MPVRWPSENISRVRNLSSADKFSQYNDVVYCRLTRWKCNSSVLSIVSKLRAAGWKYQHICSILSGYVKFLWPGLDLGNKFDWPRPRQRVSLASILALDSESRPRVENGCNHESYSLYSAPIFISKTDEDTSNLICKTARCCLLVLPIIACVFYYRSVAFVVIVRRFRYLPWRRLACSQPYSVGVEWRHRTRETVTWRVTSANWTPYSRPSVRRM